VKVRVLVTLRPGVLDAQGRAIGQALAELGYAQIREVRTGKPNPVIEQYEIEG
jgi:phosphoribosylformylglycinamidine synthase